MQAGDGKKPLSACKAEQKDYRLENLKQKLTSLALNAYDTLPVLGNVVVNRC